MDTWWFLLHKGLQISDCSAARMCQTTGEAECVQGPGLMLGPASITLNKLTLSSCVSVSG